MGHNIAQESDKGKKKTQGNVLFFLSVSGYLAMAQYSARQFSRVKPLYRKPAPANPVNITGWGNVYLYVVIPLRLKNNS